MFFLGFILGGLAGFLLLGIFAAGKPEIDKMEAFDDGVSYGLNLNRENGAIIAVNDAEIMVQYKDGTIKRLFEVKVAE